MESQPPTSSTEVRLLPLIENNPNEGLANLLTQLLVEDETQADAGAEVALMILTGIQTFIDSGGNYLAVERLWYPVVIARKFQKTYGADAANQAKALVPAFRNGGNERSAVIYERAAQLLLGNNVDKKA